MSHADWLNRAFAYRKIRKNGGDVAIAVKDGTCTHAATSDRLQRNDVTPESPMVTLLQHMTVEESTGASIYTTAVPTGMCTGMARLYGVEHVYYPGNGTMQRFVCDRRAPSVGAAGAYAVPDVTAVVAIPPAVAAAAEHHAPKAVQDFPVTELLGYLDLHTITRGAANAEPIFTYLALEIVRRAFNASGYRAEVNRTEDFWGHNIGSILVDGGVIVAWGVNTNHAEKWRHAEVNMVRSYGRQLPRNATIYTTLEPCEMCAGLITRTAGTNPITVVYAMQDPTLGTTTLRESDRVRPSTAFLDPMTRSGSYPRNDIRLAAHLLEIYRTWQEGADLPMTQFFNQMASFFQRADAARAHWFVLLWAEVQEKFRAQHRAFIDAHEGGTIQRIGWENRRVVDPRRATPLGTLLANPAHRAALEDLRATSTMLRNVYETIDAFLMRVPTVLTT
jgi:tRNA(Arg) A34 adenosine deaminase TadA